MNEEPLPQPGNSKRGLLGCLVVILLFAAGGTWWWVAHQKPEANAAAGGPGGGRGGARGGPVAVTIAPVKEEDFEEWLNLAGTVTPLNVVTVRSRVDGELKTLNFEEGQFVKKDALLAVIDPGPFQVALDQAKGNLQRDQALLDNARADLTRYQTLLKQDSIAKQQVDTQASLVRQYEAAIATGQGAVANAELNLGFTQIKAPISGRVGLRQVDPGNMIRCSDTNGLAVITQMDPMGLVFSIPQERVAAVRKRLAANDTVIVEVVDKEMKESLGKGKLLTTDNQIDLTSGTLKLKAELPNPEGALFPNQFVIAKLLIHTEPKAAVAPATSIQLGSKGAYTYVVKEDGTVSLRLVKTGATIGDRTLVAEGLTPGEKVVTQGLDRLREGAKVEIITPGGANGGSGKEPRGEGKPPAVADGDKKPGTESATP